MTKAPDLREVPELPQEIVEAGKNGELVIFVGAGASMPLGLPSWGSLAWAALKTLQKDRILNFSELEQLKHLDPKKQLSIATLLAEENGTELELTQHFTPNHETSGLYQAINDLGCVCVTTNYDELLKPRYGEAKDGSSTAVPINRVCHKENFLASLLDAPGTVVHLHGAVGYPETMVVTTKDYLEHYDDENVSHFLGELFAKKTVLFVGYRLEEVEILEYILRRGSARPGAERRRFILQGYFQSQSPLYEKLHLYYERSFGVHVIGFVRDHADYEQLEAIFQMWGPKIQINPPTLHDDISAMNEVLKNE